jgi:hypothetical protein
MVHGYDISPEAIVRAREHAKRLGVGDHCQFESVDLTTINFPPADVWFDLGCLQYLANPAPVVARLRHIPHLFSCLPQKGHWLGPMRYIYRNLVKGLPYYTFSEGDIEKLFEAYPRLLIEKSGMVYYVTTV